MHRIIICNSPQVETTQAPTKSRKCKQTAAGDVDCAAVVALQARPRALVRKADSPAPLRPRAAQGDPGQL